MKFKIGDKVKIIGGKYFVGQVGKITRISNDWPNPYLVIVSPSSDDFVWKSESNLRLVSVTPDAVGTIRTFETGATRDTAQSKLDYVKALSPIVLRRYVQYLDKHRLQSDGNYRAFNNWKQGIPQDVYHSSNGRHFIDAWLLTEGYTAEDNHGPVELEDALCAQLFNIMGRLHEILKAKLKAETSRGC